jgi:hypothetical protein
MEVVLLVQEVSVQDYRRLLQLMPCQLQYELKLERVKT